MSSFGPDSVQRVTRVSIIDVGASSSQALRSPNEVTVWLCEGVGAARANGHELLAVLELTLRSSVSVQERECLWQALSLFDGVAPCTAVDSVLFVSVRPIVFARESTIDRRHLRRCGGACRISDVFARRGVVFVVSCSMRRPLEGVAVPLCRPMDAAMEALDERYLLLGREVLTLRTSWRICSNERSVTSSCFNSVPPVTTVNVV